MPLNLLFEEPVWKKITLYTAKADGEISGMGRVERQGDTLICTEVALMPQECTGAHTEITGESISTFLSDIGQNRPETWGQWLVWWHSHVNMAPTFSTQDEETLRMLSNANEQWFLGLCINKRNESNLYYAVETDLAQLFAKMGEAKLIQPDLPPDPMEAEVLADIDRFVKKPPPKEEKPKVTNKANGMGGKGGAIIQYANQKRHVPQTEEDGAQVPFGGHGVESNGRHSNMSDRTWQRVLRMRKHNGLPDDPSVLEVIADKAHKCTNCGGNISWAVTDVATRVMELVCILCTDAVAFCACNPSSDLNKIQQEMRAWMEAMGGLGAIEDALDGDKQAIEKVSVGTLSSRVGLGW